ncbi:MAG: hypothetical protein QOI83_2337, partial [Streptomycetaceae bacterium]|nr:hypothetical protein [Streptomycetaceae bacterium]
MSLPVPLIGSERSGSVNDFLRAIRGA